MDRRIFQVRDALLANLAHNWTIEEIAEIAQLSKPHLQKLFKFETGISPIAFLREMRLEKAREHLEADFMRISEIGFEVGIADESHFTRDFKKKYGLTPTAYRKKYWEKFQAEQ